MIEYRSFSWLSAWLQNRFSPLFLLVAVFTSATLSFVPNAPAQDKRNVLILNSYHQGYKWTDDETRGAVRALDPIQNEVKIYIEYMGTKWVNDDDYFQQLRHTMKQKFREIRFDVIISSDNDALNFLVQYRDEIFGRIPTVFCGINFFTDSDIKGQPLFTGTNETADFSATLEIALKLHPSTRKVVVINDTTITGRRIHEELMHVIPSYQDRVRFEFLEDLTMQEVLTEVEQLSSDSLILYTLFFWDRISRFYEYDESMTLISQRATVPIYGTWDFSLGYGILGGKLISGQDQGRIAGEMALRILRGESIENIPVVRESPTRYMFDYRRLEHFHLSVSALPPESVIINKPVPFYSVYKGLVWVILSSVAALVCIVIVLLFNIRQRTEAQKALQSARDELEMRVLERTADLEKAIRQLRNEITERKRAEEALTASEQQLQSIIQGSPIPTFVIGSDHKVICWNKALEELAGIKMEEVVGTKQHWRAFYSNERPCMADLLVDETLEAIPQWYSGKYGKSRLLDEAYGAVDFFPDLGKNGKWLQFTAATIRNHQGELVGAMETLEDITLRRQAEEALVQAEEKYRSIFENAVMGIFQTTYDGRILSANTAFAHILGYDSPDEVTNSITDLARQVYVHPERRAELMSLIERRGIVREFEVQFYRRDRSIAWIAINLRAVRDRNGKTLYYEGTVQDITDRKLLESQLRQSHKMEAIGTLAGGIAHDFNNILAAIIGYTEMIKGRLKQVELHRYIEQVLKAGDRAKDLVGQILAFSRQAEREIKPVDVSLLTKETLKLLRATLPSTIEIRPDFGIGVGAVLADTTQLHQVIMNLCSNAAFAMSEKGGVLEVGVANMEIAPEMILHYPDLQPGPHVKLTVSDTGKGIAPEIIDRIFDPFFTTKKRGEGTGLGLSVVYGIVKEYGGTVTVQSEPGGGATFRVFLPAIEHGAQSDQEPPDAVRGHGERVIFVDDEDALAEMGRDMLEGIGYQVTATTSSTHALEIFRADPYRFDLVVTDMTMPGMTGKDLAEELLRIRPNIPIVLCTGFSGLISEAEAKELGIRAFLLKPLYLRDIAGTLRKVLDEAKG